MLILSFVNIVFLVRKNAIDKKIASDYGIK